MNDRMPCRSPLHLITTRRCRDTREDQPKDAVPLLSAAILVLALTAAGCGDGSPAPRNLVGPGQMTGQMAGGNGTGMMAGSEFAYLAAMIPHHEEAIATARILQRGTARQEMRAFAASIIETQGSEVQQMKEWLAAWYPGRDTRVAYRPMMRELAGLTGDALDRAFLEDMIPHHMMAVMMSQQITVRNITVHQDVLPFAMKIRDTQQAEIQMMSEWLRTWF